MDVVSGGGIFTLRLAHGNCQYTVVSCPYYFVFSS